MDAGGSAPSHTNGDGTPGSSMDVETGDVGQVVGHKREMEYRGDELLKDTRDNRLLRGPTLTF